MKTKTLKELDWDTWVETYRPLENPYAVSPAVDNSLLFETYGVEMEFVKKYIETNQVWTFTDIEGGTGIFNGYHFVNRIAYFITEVPYDDNFDYAVDVLLDSEGVE
jgi:hypothetical protein